jgi:hypothetical protein
MVIAEIDYMVLDKVGAAREVDVIDDPTGGAYEIPDLDVDDLRVARRLVARHQDLKIALTDAVNAVLAERYDTNEILTTNQRHLRVIAPLTRRFDAFRILLADLDECFPAVRGLSACMSLAWRNKGQPLGPSGHGHPGSDLSGRPPGGCLADCGAIRPLLHGALVPPGIWRR